MHFVLDQNFPFQATGLPWPRGVEVSPLTAIDPELTRNHDDWQVFRALARRGDVDGFITNDADILNLPREMVQLSRTQLTLVVTDGLGHDPLGATGLLMLHLPQIAKQNHQPPRIYRLRRPQLHLTRVRPLIDALATRERIPASDLVRRELAVINRIS
ncbi:MAG TPA: hypothetical protein VFL91_28240 [Thermomicrobiales bacterium]|nr:hypothetical protein [Thermomicrobiales bacterium]